VEIVLSFFEFAWEVKRFIRFVGLFIVFESFLCRSPVFYFGGPCVFASKKKL